MRAALSALAIAFTLVACASGGTADEMDSSTLSTSTAGSGGGGSGGAGGAGGNSTTQTSSGGAGGSSTTQTSSGGSGGAGGAGGNSTTQTSSGGAGGAGGSSTTQTSSGGAGGSSSTTQTGSGGSGGASSTSTGSGGGDPNGCPADQCFIEGQCVEAGTPNPMDPCQVCVRSKESLAWWPDATSPACDKLGYWTAISRALPTTPYGRKTAVSCHNCYVTDASSAVSLTKTLLAIHQAQTNGADLIELDLKDQGGVVYVDHNDAGTTSGALFDQVLADAALKSGTELLFIELKETTESEAFVRKVLNALMSHGYPKAGRPVVLRAFDNVSHNLAIARRLLATAEFVAMRPYVRLHVLIAAQQSAVLDVKQRGYHGVEFQYQSANLFGAMTYAESLDLGTNVWTIPSSMGEVFVATLRDEVDAITCDYPVASARQVIQDKNGLVYLNTSKQPAGAEPAWYKDTAATAFAPANSIGAPSLVEAGLGKPLFGSVLRFNAASGECVGTYDADNAPTGGVLVSAVVQLNETTPSLEDTSVLIGKADAGAFSLELYKPTQVLRFGVYVNGGYQYATYPISKLTTSQSYVITGAYDGDGGVWLWVNNSTADSTTVGPFTAGITQNNSPILIGADPQGGANQRFYFDGQLQMAIVQSWVNH